MEARTVRTSEVVTVRSWHTPLLHVTSGHMSVACNEKVAKDQLVLGFVESGLAWKLVSTCKHLF